MFCDEKVLAGYFPDRESCATTVIQNCNCICHAAEASCWNGGAFVPMFCIEGFTNVPECEAAFLEKCGAHALCVDDCEDKMPPSKGSKAKGGKAESKGSKAKGGKATAGQECNDCPVDVVGCAYVSACVEAVANGELDSFERCLSLVARDCQAESCSCAIVAATCTEDFDLEDFCDSSVSYGAHNTFEECMIDVFKAYGDCDLEKKCVKYCPTDIEACNTDNEFDLEAYCLGSDLDWDLDFCKEAIYAFCEFPSCCPTLHPNCEYFDLVDDYTEFGLCPKCSDMSRPLCPTRAEREEYANVFEFCNNTLGFDLALNKNCVSDCSDSIDNCCDGCFPKDAVIEVQNKGMIQMEDLELGDAVRSANGFSKVYAFGTRDLESKTYFIRLTTSSSHVLELSMNHLVFTGAHLQSKLAANVVIGEELFVMPEKQLSKIVSIETIEKQGPVHPLTYDGTIIVNNIWASAHSVGESAPVIKIGDYYILDEHQFQQLLLAPLRVLCKLSPETFCSAGNHAPDDGTHYWVDVIEALHAFLIPEAVLRTELHTTEVNFIKVSGLLPLKLAFLTWITTFAVVDYFLNAGTIFGITTAFLIFIVARRAHRFGGLVPKLYFRQRKTKRQ